MKMKEQKRRTKFKLKEKRKAKNNSGNYKMAYSEKDNNNGRMVNIKQIYTLKSNELKSTNFD